MAKFWGITRAPQFERKRKNSPGRKNPGKNYNKSSVFGGKKR